MKRLIRQIGLLLAALILLSILPAKADTAQPVILRARTDGAIVHVVTDRPVSAYCITTQPVIPPEEHTDWRPISGSAFAAFKMDGTYYVRVRDANGSISEPVQFTIDSGYRYVIEAKGQDHLTEPIRTFLAEHGDSLGAFNLRIAKSAKKGGLYTRTGVANAVMQFMSDMAGYHMTLSYQPRGNFSAEDDWGLSPKWGTNLRPVEHDGAGTYRQYGMNCGTILIWAYKQAGLNIGSTEGRRGIYDSGIYRKRDDNRRNLDNGDTCDLIATHTGHTMMILDRVDTDEDGLSDSYLVLEMESPYLKLKLRSLHSVRMCTLYDMSAVFDDTGMLKKNLRVYKGMNSFHIRIDAFPAYYRQLFKPEGHLPATETEF